MGYTDDWTDNLDARRKREEIRKKRELEQRRPTKKFYVGQQPDRMTPGWSKATLDEAVEHAKQICEADAEGTAGGGGEGVMKHIAVIFNEDSHLVHVTEATEDNFTRLASDWCHEHCGHADTRCRIVIWEVGAKQISEWTWEMDKAGKVVHLYPL